MPADVLLNSDQTEVLVLGPENLETSNQILFTLEHNEVFFFTRCVFIHHSAFHH